MFIVLLTYIKPLAEVDRFVHEHSEFLDEQYRAGRFLLSGRKEPRTGGVILARADNRSQLDEVLKLDPFYREQIARYEITQFIPGKSCEGMRSLLE